MIAKGELVEWQDPYDAPPGQRLPTVEDLWGHQNWLRPNLSRSVASSDAGIQKTRLPPPRIQASLLYQLSRLLMPICGRSHFAITLNRLSHLVCFPRRTCRLSSPDRVIFAKLLAIGAPRQGGYSAYYALEQLHWQQQQ